MNCFVTEREAEEAAAGAVRGGGWVGWVNHILPRQLDLVPQIRTKIGMDMVFDPKK